MLQAIKAWHADNKMHAEMCAHFDGGHWPLIYAQNALYELRMRTVAALVCKRKGHAWRDDSLDVAWQDGEFAMECERCHAQAHGWW